MFAWERECYFHDKHEEVALPVPLPNMLALAWLKRDYQTVANKHMSRLVEVVGRHRSGKSICASVFGRIIDNSFWRDYEQRVFSQPVEFMSAVERVEAENIRNPVFQIDEAATMVGNMDYYTEFSKNIVKATAVLGYLHPTIFYCLPVGNLMSTNLRRMFHHKLYVKRSDNKSTYIKAYDTEYSPLLDKPFFKRPRVRVNGRMYTIKGIRMTLPPRELIERYDKFSIPAKKKELAKIRVEMQKSITDGENKMKAKQEKESALALKRLKEDAELVNNGSFKASRTG